MMDPDKILETESENDKDSLGDTMGEEEPALSSSSASASAAAATAATPIQTTNSTSMLATTTAAAAPTYHGSRSASHIGRKPAFGQTCSMRTLLQDGILQAGEKVLTLEYEDTKFYGDLRRDGTIMMRDKDDSPHIYATPVAWANHCCKMLNPESKPLNAWSSIRFRGKRLDSYKLKWYRAQKKPNMMNNNNNNNNINDNLTAAGINMIGAAELNLHNNNNNNNANSIIRNLQNLQQFNNNNLANQQGSGGGGSGRLMVHNPITNYLTQYENPLKNKKLIKSLLISNNMDNDCKRLVAKSLDQSVDPCLMTQQMNDNISNNTDGSNLDTTNTSNNNVSKNGEDDGEEPNHSDHINNTSNTDNHCKTLRTTVISYDQLGTRGPHNTHNPNTMVKCIPFSAVDRIQPFNVTVSTNALLLVDFHSHLVSGEVAGYLAGSWDFSSHTLTVTQAFPCRTDLSQEANASAIEEEIRQDIEKRQLTLVGWYHSHQGKYSNHPTIKDIQNQMEYQITLKESATNYIPCVGLICSPHDTRTEDDLSPSFQIYWVMPPPEHLANHYGRPMQMYYSVTRDLFLTQDLLLEMRLLANHYVNQSSEMVDFKAPYEHNDRFTNLDKLSGSIKPKLPKDLQESEYPDEPGIWKAAVDHFWKFLKNLVVASSSKSAADQPEEPEPAVESQGEEQASEQRLEIAEVVAEEEEEEEEEEPVEPVTDGLLQGSDS